MSLLKLYSFLIGSEKNAQDSFYIFVIKYSPNYEFHKFILAYYVCYQNILINHFLSAIRSMVLTFQGDI